MKIIKINILLLLVFVQCYFCGQINNEMTMQYYDQGFKESAFLSLPAHLDTIEDNKALYHYIIENQDKDVTFVNTTMKQSKSNVYLKSNDATFMKSIFSSSDAIRTLSGGEQQRVALARVLLKDCRIILADEPTGNLDEHNKKLVFSLLRKLQQNGKTIIMVTHDVSLASLCDACIELKK